MAVFKLGPFLGERPILEPAYLEDLQAERAENCVMDTGGLRPLKSPLFQSAQVKVGTIQSIYKYAQGIWFEWPDIVNVARPQVENDLYDRVIITGLDFPRVTYNAIASTGPQRPTSTLRLGIPPPEAAPTLQVTGIADDASDIPDTRTYVFTFVDVFGAEGANSIPSAEVEVMPGQGVTVTLGAVPGGPYNFTLKRIYRSTTGSSDVAYQYVGEVAIGETTFVDTVLGQDLGEVLATTTYDMPPTTLRGIVAVPNGYLAAFYGNTLCFSEPGAPHAWPIEYRLQTKAPIMSLGVFGGTIVVTTRENPYVVVGSTPETSSIAEIEIDEPCVSARASVDMGTSVIYPGSRGLVQVSPGGPRLLTQDVFSEEQWREMDPSTMHAYLWKGLYLCFYYASAQDNGCFVIDPDRPTDGVRFFDIYGTAGYWHSSEGCLYLMVGGNLVKWDAGADLSYIWLSRPYLTQFLPAPACGQVLSNNYPVTLTLIADGVVKHTQAVADFNPFRMPSGYRAQRYQVELSGTGQVVRAAVAGSMAELARA